MPPKHKYPQTRWFLSWAWRFTWRFLILWTVALVVLFVAGWDHHWQTDTASALVVGVTLTWTLARAGDPDAP